jgi:hypothetical protein
VFLDPETYPEKGFFKTQKVEKYSVEENKQKLARKVENGTSCPP